MAIWKAFYVRCGKCGHRNRPHRSPMIGVMIALEGPIECKNKRCKRTIDAREDLRRSERPLIKMVIASLQKQQGGMVPA